MIRRTRKMQQDWHQFSNRMNDIRRSELQFNELQMRHRNHRFHVWLASWADLVDALCSVFTAGFYNPWLGFKVRVYFDKKYLQKRLNKQ